MKLIKVLVFLYSGFLLTGCATILNGYDEKITIFGTSENLEVTTQDGVKLEVKKVKTDYPIPDKRGDKRVEANQIEVINGKEYVLTLKDGDKTHKVQLKRKLGAGWFAMDLIFGIVPAIYDGITGNWYYYDDIDLNTINKK